MGDVQPGVVSDHVVVDGEDGLGVRLDPGNLGHHGHQIIGLREEGEEANIIFIKIANIFRVGRRGPATLECFRPSSDALISTKTLSRKQEKKTFE